MLNKLKQIWTQYQNKRKRIEIVKDSLAQLNTLNIKTGNVLSWDKESIPLYKGCVQENLDYVRKNCNVCLKGALLLSHVDKYNKLNFENIEYCVLDQDALVKRHLNYFDKYQLDLMEAAFEGQGCDYIWSELTNKDFETCFDFYHCYVTPKERARAILENILRNNGIFDPEDIDDKRNEKRNIRIII